MSTFYTTIGPLQLQTFTLALAVAVVAGIGWSAYRLPDQRGAVVDAGLGALAGGVIGARLAHVLLNWTYFAYNTDEIWRLRSGGLDWHGALLGCLIGLWVVSRWRGLDFVHLLDVLAPALPLLALAGWWGCRAANCGFGIEVDTLANYPPLLVAELPDVYGIPAPRYNTQLFGLALALPVFVLTVWIFWRELLIGRRFWLVLALLSAGMFGIGFYRADYALRIANLRADQWLDLVVLVVSVVYLGSRRKSRGGSETLPYTCDHS
jgi:phosphatidylglycerol:prolipoprotein diacylglycerol transferase